LEEITPATEQSVPKQARQYRTIYWLLLAIGLLGLFVSSYLVIAGDHDKMPLRVLPAIFWYYLVVTAFSVAVLDVAVVTLFARSPRTRAATSIVAATLLLLQGLLRGLLLEWDGLALYYLTIGIGLSAASVWLAVEAVQVGREPVEAS
jgi:hypothetical protein